MKTDLMGLPFGGGQFNTLAQSGTGLPQTIVTGKGTLLNKDALLKKAKKKTIAQKMMLYLIDEAQNRKNSKLEKSFWNTWHCQNQILSSSDRSFGQYCGNRFCFICCGIRKAKIINKYLPIIQKWEEPYFTILTVKSVPAERLNLMVNKMNEGFNRIVNKYKKRNQRGKDIKLFGVRSFECNFNPNKKTYNPHINLILPNKEISDIFLYEWWLLWTKNGSPKYSKWVNKDSQFSRKIFDSEKCLIEIVKYVSKIFTEPDPNNINKKKVPRKIYIRAWYNIIVAMKDHRLFDRFGFNLPASDKNKIGNYTLLNKIDEWEFESKKCDWINKKTGRPFSGYSPTPDLSMFLENNIDTILQ